MSTPVGEYRCAPIVVHSADGTRQVVMLALIEGDGETMHSFALEHETARRLSFDVLEAVVAIDKAKEQADG